jgi:hypothetical protein
MSRTRRTLWQLRGGILLLALAAVAVTAAFPRPAWAACGPMDLGGCADNAEYSFYYGIASFAWSVNRWLLILAYQLDQLRGWLITVAFSGAYQWLTSFVQPAYIPIATAALMLAAILFMLVPITGKTGFVSIRHVVIWAVLTPVILTVAGQMIGQAEQVRSDISSQLFAQMSRAAPGALFGSSGSDMAAPTPLYPSNPCGTTLTRTTVTGLAMDALAATLAYADAGDVHCSDARGPSRDIPDGMYNNPPAYAYNGSVGDLDSSVERRGWVEGMQRGMVRLLQSIVPSFLAVLESLIHLVFSLSMALLWLSLPIGLLFVWFQQTASPISGVLRRAASVLIVSWMASMVMGVLSSVLVAAAQLGNAGAYTGMAFGGLFLMGYLALLAFSTLWKSIGTIEQTALSVTGMSFTEPFQTAASTAVGVAAGMATGGAAMIGGAAAGAARGGAASAAMAAAGSMAFAQSGEAPLGSRAAFAVSAMVGRLPGAGQVGEVAAAMGWIDSDSAAYRGLHAGELSLKDWRRSRLEMERATSGGGPDYVVRAPSSVAPAPSAWASVGGPGPRGASGPAGFAGTAGAPASGPVGPAGPAGAPGAGSPGPAGLGSVPGVGAPGSASPAGAAGAPGVGSPGPFNAPAASGASAAPTAPTAPDASISPVVPAAHGSSAAPTPPVSHAAVGSAPAPGAGSSRVEGVEVAPLPPSHLHAVYAASQVSSTPNAASGADWRYVGSVQTATGFRHAFQHPAHPLTGRPEVRWVESTTADVAAGRNAQTGRLS